MARILVVDDEQDIRDALKRVCSKDGHEVLVATNGREAVDMAKGQRPDLIVLDNRMPGLSGLEALARIRESDRDVVVLMYTAYDDPADVHRAVVELGAYGFLLKSSGSDAVRASIQQALRSRGKDGTRRPVDSAHDLDFGGMLGRSRGMQHVFTLIRKISHSDVTVLIQGESGTGKELVARAIHDSSSRHAGPYVTVDCGTLPDTLMESELFGYEAGAFTDARRSKLGKVEVAHGGTLFLDEIGNLPLSAQAKLLRVLEDRRLSRLGENTVREVDVRILAASNLDLESAAREKLFREDLYYRLNVFKLVLPPLRDRRDDIPRLIEHFAGVHAATQGKPGPQIVSPEAMAALVARPWPGNIRELRNVMERAVLLSDEVILPEHLADEPGGTAPAPGPAAAAAAGPALADPAPGLAEGDDLVLPPVDLERVPLKEAKRMAGERVERAYILAALRQSRWNKSKAARVLGLNYKTLREKIREHDLERLRWQDA
jgi:DNA-binding NtrC family response regulator